MSLSSMMKKIMVRLLERIFSLIRLVEYNIELKRLDLKLRLHSEQTDSTIKEINILYKEYLKRVLKKEIFPQGRPSNYHLFYPKQTGFDKKKYSARSTGLTKSEEVYMIELLTRRTSRWFVPHYIEAYDYFSESLMKALVDTGLKVLDQSYNACFINPATRVYEEKANDYILERFLNSTLNQKNGIFRALYWMQLDAKSEQYEQRLSAFLRAYEETKSKKLKYYLSLNLPEILDDYPGNLKPLAARYLEHRITTK